MDIFLSTLQTIFSLKTLLGAIVIFLVFSSVFVVRGKTAAILETFGKPQGRAKLPGLHFKLPWPITSVVAHVNLQLLEISANVSIKTKDNAFMTLPVKVQYRASDEPEGAVKAHYELDDPEEQIASYVLNNVRQTGSTLDMEELYANRNAMEHQVQESLSVQFARYGYIIENVLVDEPQPSSEVRDAFNRVIASKRLKEAATNEAEAARIKLVGVAEAESASKKLQGEGMANMRKAVAQGLKEAMETMEEAGLDVKTAIDFLNFTNRYDTISSAASHGNLVIIDAGSGSQVAEMIGAVKAAMGKSQDEPPHAAPAAPEPPKKAKAA